LDPAVNRHELHAQGEVLPAAEIGRREAGRRQGGIEHGSGLGAERWVVERTFAWLHDLRQLRIRYERRPELHLAFMRLGCAVICQRMLSRP
jgi:transposase